MSFQDNQAKSDHIKVDQKISIENTIAQLKKSIWHLENQARSANITLPTSTNLKTEDEVKDPSMFVVLPHTQISSTTNRGTVGTIQSTKNVQSKIMKLGAKRLAVRLALDPEGRL